MNKPVFFILFLFSFTFCTAQANLVPNPSFEEFWECPQNPNNDGIQFEKCKYWQRANEATSDYYHKCAPLSSDVSTPQNWHGYQEPKDGQGYVGVLGALYHSGHPDAEYIQCELKETLKPCTEYYVSFWLNLADYSSLSINSIGLRFDDYPIKNTGGYALVGFNDLPCHICYEEFITDTVNWTKVSGSYLANGKEKYLTIGRFFNNPMYNNWSYPTIPIDCDSCFSNHPSAYYYIDSVTVTEKGALAIVTPNVFTPNEDGINDIWRIPFNCAENWYGIILNRWGSVVHSFSNGSVGWDGNDTKGMECAEGVYYFKLFYDEKEKTGFIQLIR